MEYTFGAHRAATARQNANPREIPSGAGKVKVVHVCETLKGGVGSYLDEILPAQSRTFGKDNVVLVAPANQLVYLSTFSRDLVCIPFRRTGRNFQSLTALASAIRRSIILHRPDVIHLHSSFAGSVGRLVVRTVKKRPRVVYCSHGWAFNMPTSAWRKRAFAFAERLLARWSDVIVNVSRYENNAAITAGLDPKKCKIVNTGIGMSNFHNDETIDFDSNVINILFVGRLDKEKGFDYLSNSVDMWCNLPVHLHVVGDAVVSRAREKMQSSETITFYGWQPRARVEAFLRAADVLIMPSRAEAFGLAAVEAMRAKRAVAASNCGGLPEIVVGGVTGLIFEPRNIAQAINEIVLIGREKLLAMGQAGHRRFMEQYEASRMNESLENLYYEITGASVAREQTATATPSLPQSVCMPN